MTQDERRVFLIERLLAESKEYKDMKIPSGEDDRKRLLRSLLNVRPPKEASPDFLAVQDEYLKESISEKGITHVDSLSPLEDGIYLWQGDITAIDADAIVNAANSGMTGCYQPCHACIDNCIHTYAGIQLRARCSEIMTAQGYPEPTGKAKITPAYNLPSKYVIHTVGPIVRGALTESHKALLKSSYESCLDVAEENGVKSIAFCCISTGVFGFPKTDAARIATDTVRNYKRENKSEIKVIFNVFTDEDYCIYRGLLG